jgi:hypothetical protein
MGATMAVTGSRGRSDAATQRQSSASASADVETKADKTAEKKESSSDEGSCSLIDALR